MPLIPSFPPYTGPHPVGTLDVEIPISSLPSPCPRPEGAEHIQTVQFRVFYPAVPGTGGSKKGKRATWLPAPQREHIAGYTKFAGASSFLAGAFSFLPRHLHYATIPATKNAPLPPGPHPAILFSHGLGGSRNAYSHTAGSLASHGAVVFCPEHRDGSAIASFIRDPSGGPSVPVRYRRISHDVSPEMYAAREGQLRIRLWELALVYEAVLKLNDGEEARNLNASTLAGSLGGFKGALDLRPGRLVFAGHSFGSATVVQLLKSTYYASTLKMDNPLFTPGNSSLRQQITPTTPALLLDLWATPMLGPSSAPLLSLPLPCYAGPGGSAILSVLSEAFHGWAPHLLMTARILSPSPSSEILTEASFLDADGKEIPRAHLFYVPGSAHLSQSDFGVLFPRLVRRKLGVSEPARVSRLNLRAALQFLRENGVKIAQTCNGDLVEGPSVAEGDAEDDSAILMREGVIGWAWIDSVALFAGKGGEKDGGVAGVEDTEAGMETEIEAGVQEATVEGSREKVDGQEMPMPVVKAAA